MIVKIRSIRYLSYYLQVHHEYTLLGMIYIVHAQREIIILGRIL